MIDGFVANGKWLNYAFQTCNWQRGIAQEGVQVQECSMSGSALSWKYSGQVLLGGFLFKTMIEILNYATIPSINFKSYFPCYKTF
jgi:hypothetical protein